MLVGSGGPATAGYSQSQWSVRVLTVIFVISVPENPHAQNIIPFYDIEIFCPTPYSILTNNVSYVH